MTERRAVVLRGTVQGVGFRPFVHGVATRLRLGGFVRNRTDGVLVEVEGEPARLDSFVAQLRDATSCPPLARIESVETAEIASRGETVFSIVESDPTAAEGVGVITADAGTCEACLREVLDPADRRFRHPFANCTGCGPRLTIVRGLPYDRPRTTLAAFPLCARCRTEYDDPADRRFHAQPIACPDCGPRLTARDERGAALDLDPLSWAAESLLAGRILAVKGIGGYHLACDATNEAAVARLRRRKGRDGKPFALLVPDLEVARRLCEVSAEEAALLASAARPIVLLRRSPDGAGPPVAKSVAPALPSLGLMLPPTTLHHLLARDVGGRPLVLTSGNRSEGPIAFEDDDALRRLGGIADGFLTHDRPIAVRCDDSVTRVIRGAPAVVRRSRGMVPAPVRLPIECRETILAVGGHLKCTVAFGRGAVAIPSHHLGDLGDWDAFRAFREAIAHYESLYGFSPTVLAHDLHPDYASTAYARERAAAAGLRLVGVQHHHAHLASGMAEHGLTGEAIGVTFDGSGWGPDGTVWGGEVLVGGYAGFRRAAHLRPVPLPGGERAIREPWRMAVSHLLDCGEDPERFFGEIPADARRTVRRMAETRLNAPLTSSAGRLFDAVAAILGRHLRVSYEAQAAIELEALAARAPSAGTYPFDLAIVAGGGLVADTRPLVGAIVRDRDRGVAHESIARRFHDTLGAMVVALVRGVRDQTGLADVVLSGGVFLNALLLERAATALAEAGFRVRTHSRIPSNDGGLSLGQLAVAAAVVSEGGP